MSLRKSDILLEDLVDTNTRSPFNLLLGPFLVLLAHVHDGSCGGTVELVTIHALEVLRDLIGHTTVLALTRCATLLVRVGILQLIAKSLIRDF